jgi:hypothetical protein
VGWRAMLDNVLVSFGADRPRPASVERDDLVGAADG